MSYLLFYTRVYGTLLLLAALPLILSACKDKDEVDYVEKETIGWIRFSSDRFELGPDAATLRVKVEVNNVPLHAEIQWVYPWITSCRLVEQEQGGKSRIDTYLITVEANDTYAKRTGNVDFYAGYNEDKLVRESIYISQEMTNNH
jgi:hypothetical protein